MDEKLIKNAARETLRLIKENQELKSLLKKPAGIHLSEAGKAAINVGIERGMTQARIAKLLDITPPAVSRYVNNT